MASAQEPDVETFSPQPRKAWLPPGKWQWPDAGGGGPGTPAPPDDYSQELNQILLQRQGREAAAHTPQLSLISTSAGSTPDPRRTPSGTPFRPADGRSLWSPDSVAEESRDRAGDKGGDLLQRRKVFVGGVPQDIGQKELVAFFGKFAAVKTAWVQKHRGDQEAKGRPPPRSHRGFGFVVFIEVGAVDALLGRQAATFLALPDGRRLEVKRSFSSGEVDPHQGSATEAPRSGGYGSAPSTPAPSTPQPSRGPQVRGGLPPCPAPPFPVGPEAVASPCAAYGPPQYHLGAAPSPMSPSPMSPAPMSPAPHQGPYGSPGFPVAAAAAPAGSPSWAPPGGGRSQPPGVLLPPCRPLPQPCGTGMAMQPGPCGPRRTCGPVENNPWAHTGATWLPQGGGAPTGAFVAGGQSPLPPRTPSGPDLAELLQLRRPASGHDLAAMLNCGAPGDLESLLRGAMPEHYED